MGHDKFKEITIPLRSGNISGCWYGNQHERPILAVHGWGDNAGTFTPLIPLLANDVAILAIDLPGHGRSSSYPHGIKYNVLSYMSTLREIMLYYKWPKLSLMGHSMGAGISFFMAALFPGLVDIIIAIDAFSVYQLNTDEQIKDIYNSIENYLQDSEKIMIMEKSGIASTAFTYEQLQNMIYKATGKSVHIENTKYLLERAIEKSATEENKFHFKFDKLVKYMNNFFADNDLEDAMAMRIRGVKFLVLKSDKSPVINFKKFLHLAEILQHKNKLLEFYVIPNTTHHLHLNNADLVAPYISAFLKTNRQTEIMNKEGKL